MADLEVTMHGRVMVATLNRPDKKNALSDDMLGAFRDALARANDDPDVGCVVLTGAGDAFCSGGDLGKRANEKNTGDPTPLDRRSRLQMGPHKVALAVELFEKPLIAAVNGAAVGAGMDLALMCDMRIAATSARFSEGYVRVGLLPGNGGCWFLPRLVGTAKALQLLWTGDFVSGDEAVALGIANEVFADDQLLEKVLDIATRIADGPPLQLRDIKKLVYEGQRTDLRTALNSVSAHMAVIQATADYKEAILAFREKRPGKYQGK